MGQKEAFRQAFCFATENKIVSLAEIRIPIAAFRLSRQKKPSAWGACRGLKFGKAFPILDIHFIPVIQACTSQPPVIDQKTKGLNQVQLTPRRQTEPGDISGIRRNFRFDKHNVEHAFVKTKKAPQRPRRFFRREGNNIAGSVSRTQLRRFDRFDIYPSTVPVETYNAVYQSENRIIPTQPDVFPRQKFGSSLADNYVARDPLLAAKFFYTQAFTTAVASVLDTTLPFFMSHTSKLQ